MAHASDHMPCELDIWTVPTPPATPEHLDLDIPAPESTLAMEKITLCESAIMPSGFTLHPRPTLNPNPITPDYFSALPAELRLVIYTIYCTELTDKIHSDEITTLSALLETLHPWSALNTPLRLEFLPVFWDVLAPHLSTFPITSLQTMESLVFQINKFAGRKTRSDNELVLKLDFDRCLAGVTAADFAFNVAGIMHLFKKTSDAEGKNLFVEEQLAVEKAQMTFPALGEAPPGAEHSLALDHLYTKKAGGKGCKFTLVAAIQNKIQLTKLVVLGPLHLLQWEGSGWRVPAEECWDEVVEGGEVRGKEEYLMTRGDVFGGWWERAMRMVREGKAG